MTNTPLEYERLLEYVLSGSTWDLFQELRPYNCTCSDHGFATDKLRSDGSLTHYPLCPVGKWQILGDKLEAVGVAKLDAARTKAKATKAKATAKKTAAADKVKAARAKVAAKTKRKPKAAAKKVVKTKTKRR